MFTQLSNTGVTQGASKTSGSHLFYKLLKKGLDVFKN